MKSNVQDAESVRFCRSSNQRTMPCKYSKSNSEGTFKRTSMSLFRAVLLSLIIFALSGQCSGTKSRKKVGKWRTECKVVESGWSDCSKTCGMGSSTRVRTKGRCKTLRESRLCMVKLCEESYFGRQSNGRHRCLRHKRSRKREYLTYAGAKSEKKYKMRYCGRCSVATKCCTPTKTRTKKVKFISKDGKRFSKKMSFIRKCSCHSDCSASESRMVFTLELHDDMHIEDPNQPPRTHSNSPPELK